MADNDTIVRRVDEIDKRRDVINDDPEAAEEKRSLQYERASLIEDWLAQNDSQG